MYPEFLQYSQRAKCNFIEMKQNLMKMGTLFLYFNKINISNRVSHRQQFSTIYSPYRRLPCWWNSAGNREFTYTYVYNLRNSKATSRIVLSIED